MLPTDPQEWVKGSHVTIDMDVQGDRNRWTDGRKNPKFLGKVLGGRAAFKVDVQTLLHEFAHFIETERRRFCHSNYGLRIREVEILGELCYDPQTAQATLREIRTMGIQCVLGEHFGCLYDIRGDLAHLVKWLPDSTMAYGHFGLSWSDPALDSMTICERDTLLYDRVAAEIRKEMEKHTVEGLYKVFRERCAIHDTYVGRAHGRWF